MSSFFTPTLALMQARELVQALERERELVQALERARELVQALELVQEHEQERTWKQALERARELVQVLELPELGPDCLELAIEIPENTPPERVGEIVRQAALKADAVYRAHGGQGLRIDTIDIFEERLVPEGSRR
jgi:hypothetical protein